MKPLPLLSLACALVISAAPIAVSGHNSGGGAGGGGGHSVATGAGGHEGSSAVGHPGPAHGTVLQHAKFGHHWDGSHVPYEGPACGAGSRPHGTPWTCLSNRGQEEYLALRDEALAVQRADAGELTAKHRAEIQSRLDAVLRSSN
jgi:hypothetical protein